VITQHNLKLGLLAEPELVYPASVETMPTTEVDTMEATMVTITAGPIQVHQVQVRVLLQHPLLIMPMAITCLRPRQSICNILIQQPRTNKLIKGIIGKIVLMENHIQTSRYLL
jgi:hypothetical protein